MNFYKFKILKYSFPFQRLIFISRPETSTQGVIKFPNYGFKILISLSVTCRGKSWPKFSDLSLKKQVVIYSACRGEMATKYFRS